MGKTVALNFAPLASENLIARALPEPAQKMDPNVIALGAVWYIAFLFSTSCHEASHALAAKIGGYNRERVASANVCRVEGCPSEGTVSVP